jgi:adenylosuccinate synthase
LAKLLATASGSLPEVEAKIMQLTEQMTSGVKQNQEEMVKSARESATVLQGVIADLRKAFNETTEQLTSHVKQNQAEMTKTVRDSAVTLQGAVADIKNLLLETTQSTNRQINEHMKELAEKTTDQLVKLDVALETELSKSISSLGRHLTSLSGKFVEDYAPLTEKLRLLVQTSKGA